MRKLEWKNVSNHLHDDDFDDDDDDFDDDDNSLSQKFGNLPSIMNTPFGMFRSDQKFGNPFSENDIWECSTNFTITENDVINIEKAEGVDGLKILSRYSFVIIVGKLFDSEITKFNVQNALGVEIENQAEYYDQDLPESVKEKVITEMKRVSEASSYWCIYIFPNGEITSMAMKNMEEYVKYITVFKDLNKLSDGILINSRNEKK